MTKSLSRDGKGDYIITEVYGPRGAPKSFNRSRGSHWIETANDDGTVSRIYCDAVSWQQQMDAYKREYRHPHQLYATFDDGREDWRAAEGYEDNELFEHAQPSPTYCRVVAAVISAILIVFAPLILVVVACVWLFDLVTSAPHEVRDWGFGQMFEDMIEMWSGKPPKDFQ